MVRDTLEVLQQIRDEVKRTNTRLASLEGRVDQTNTSLASLEGRVDQTNTSLASLEGRVSTGFNHVSERMDGYVERLDMLTRRQTDSELRLATEVLSLADVTRQVRDLLATKLDDHHTVANHEERLRSIENRIADRPSE